MTVRVGACLSVRVGPDRTPDSAAAALSSQTDADLAAWQSRVRVARRSLEMTVAGRRGNGPVEVHLCPPLPVARSKIANGAQVRLDRLAFTHAHE